MGKGKKSQNKVKYQPISDEIINTLTQDKRSEIKTPNNENNSKKDVKKSLFEDVNKFQESLKEGTNFDVAINKSKFKNNECNSNEKIKSSKKVMSLDHQYENSSYDKKKQSEKMECDVSESIYMNNNKDCEEMNKNKNKEKKNKNLILDLNINNSSESLDNEEKFENNNSKKVLKDSMKSSKSNKKEKTQESLLDQQSKNSSLDEKTDGETKHMNKNNDKVGKKNLFDRKSQNDSDEKSKYELSNPYNKINKKDERKLNNNSDSNKKIKSNYRKFEDNGNKLETTSTYQKPEDELIEDKNQFSKLSHNVYDISNDNHEDENQSVKERPEVELKKGRNQSLRYPRSAYNNKHQHFFNSNRNNNYEDRSQSHCERPEDKFKKNGKGSSRWSQVPDTITSSNNHEDGSQSDCESFLKEIDEDLFNLPEDIALAHCVAEDLRMGAGIAVDFKKKFGGVGKLIDQNLKIGNVGIVKRHNQYVFYLITKKYSRGKPTMMTLKMALESLLSMMKDHKLTKLGIPTIGCGLDGLDWSDVKSLIYKIFAGSGIHISVCIPSNLLDRQTSSPLKVYMTPNNLWEMEPQTDIIIFIDLDKIKKNDWTDDVINKVDNKYPFKNKLLKEVENKKLNSGEILSYDVKNEKIFCVFFEQEKFYECVENVFAAKYFKSKSNTNYLAIQSGSFNSDDTFKCNVWIVLIFRSISSNNELWLCGDTENNKHGFLYDIYYKNLSNSNLKNDYSYSSPMSRDYKYNDNNQSSSSKERSFNNISFG